jgi:Holliday junction resolvasome RuvABC endonuclease subunit
LNNKGRFESVSDKETPIKILGFDCSSSTVGWGLVGVNGKEINLLSYGHFKPLKSTYDLIYRLDNLYDSVSELCNKLKPTDIAVEEIVKFMPGLSKSSTIITLAVFNRVLALSAYRENKINVNFYPVSTIRKLIKDKNFLSETIKKEEMPEVVSKYLSNAFKGSINKKGNVSVETGDEADGIAVAWARAIEVAK